MILKLKKMFETVFIVLILDVIALIYFVFPPKKVNIIYGYRTSRTLQNDKIFSYANKYASKYMLVLSVLNTIVNLFLILLNYTNINLAAFTSIASLIVAIILTEKKLNKYSDE